MKFHAGFSLEYIEDLIPWEKEVYLELLNEYIKAENERKELERRQNGG